MQLYVFGEVSEPHQETVNLVEEIVRDQIVEIVCPSPLPLHRHYSFV